MWTNLIFKLFKIDVSSFINKQNDVVVVATTTPITQSVIYSSDSCPLIETNVDYKGNDTDYKFSTSVESCCNICSNNEGCTGFTYIRYTNEKFLNFINKKS